MNLQQMFTAHKHSQRTIMKLLLQRELLDTLQIVLSTMLSLATKGGTCTETDIVSHMTDAVA